MNHVKSAVWCIVALLILPALVSATDWPLVAFDTSYSRNSPQTVIGAGNVNQLQAKWIFNTNYAVEAPPLIVGNTAYIQNNAMQVFAVDLQTGLNTWQWDPRIPRIGMNLPRASTSHGMTYKDGVVYAPTGPNGTVVALDARTGKKIWETLPLDKGPAFRNSAPPIFWNGIIIGGSALGDEPPFGVAQKGTVTGVDMDTGTILWQTPLAVGPWVTTAPNASQNGGATTWTGGAIDTDLGVAYLPVGNPSPDFLPEVRAPVSAEEYANRVIALNITDGRILWATPFIAQGSVLPDVVPLDGHDWDTSWGTNLVTVDRGKGPQKIVIGHDKRGDLMAMDAATGTPLWWVTLTAIQNAGQNPTPQGTDVVIPGPNAGICGFTATDGTNVYAPVCNTAGRYYSRQPSFLAGTGTILEGGFVPDFSVFPNGFANGSVTAVDLRTGKVVWTHPTDYGTYVSPLVTNGVVFSGQLTDQGKPFVYGDFGGPGTSPLVSSGMVMALDAGTGKLLWQYNCGAQVAVGGPSIGNGYLLVPTGGIQNSNNGGYVIAFALPGTASGPGGVPATPAAGMVLPALAVIAIVCTVFLMRRKRS